MIFSEIKTKLFIEFFFSKFLIKLIFKLKAINNFKLTKQVINLFINRKENLTKKNIDNNICQID